MQGALFEFNLDENLMPEDNTEIFPAIIYFNKDEHAEFKKLLKLSIKKLYPDDYENQNGSNALLLILKKFNYDQENV